MFLFFVSSRRRHTRWPRDWSSDVCSSDLKVFINENQSNQQQWQDFGHEMYHYCHDYVVYDRLHETYAEYGESKADYFAYHFCVPTFMLMDLKEVNIYVIRSEEHTSELQSRGHLVCRLLLEK